MFPCTAGGVSGATHHSPVHAPPFALIFPDLRGVPAHGGGGVCAAWQGSGRDTLGNTASPAPARPSEGPRRSPEPHAPHAASQFTYNSASLARTSSPHTTHATTKARSEAPRTPTHSLTHANTQGTGRFVSTTAPNTYQRARTISSNNHSGSSPPRRVSGARGALTAS